MKGNMNRSQLKLRKETLAVPEFMDTNTAPNAGSQNFDQTWSQEH